MKPSSQASQSRRYTCRSSFHWHHPKCSLLPSIGSKMASILFSRYATMMGPLSCVSQTTDELKLRLSWTKTWGKLHCFHFHVVMNSNQMPLVIQMMSIIHLGISDGERSPIELCIVFQTGYYLICRCFLQLQVCGTKLSVDNCNFWSIAHSRNISALHTTHTVEPRYNMNKDRRTMTIILLY